MTSNYLGRVLDDVPVVDRQPAQTAATFERAMTRVHNQVVGAVVDVQRIIESEYMAPTDKAEGIVATLVNVLSNADLSSLFYLAKQTENFHQAYARQQREKEQEVSA